MLGISAWNKQKEVQQKEKDDEEEDEDKDKEEDKGPVPAVPEATSTTVSTTLTMPGLKRLYKRSQVQQQQQTTPNDILQAMCMSLLQ